MLWQKQKGSAKLNAQQVATNSELPVCHERPATLKNLRPANSALKLNFNVSSKKWNLEKWAKIIIFMPITQMIRS